MYFFFFYWKVPYLTNYIEIFQPKFQLHFGWQGEGEGVKLNQLEAEHDVVKTMSNLASSEGDGVTGLQSHVERPGAQ